MAPGRCVLLLMLLTSLPASACASGAATTGTSRPAPHSSHTAAPHGPVLAGTVQTSEDVSLDTSFHASVDSAVSGAQLTSPPAPSCAAYAASSSGVFFPPEFDVVSADHSLYFSATAQSYHGPGAYESAGDGTLTGTISVGVGVGGAQQTAYSIFRSMIGGSSTLTVRADGSGTFTFSEWGSDEVRGTTGSAASISGTVTWTCG